MAIDQGTTSTRAMIFNHAGEVIGAKQTEHDQHSPQPGGVEHDPLEIWSSSQFVVQGVLNENNRTPQDLAAIGITNQRETTLVWNRETGKPYYPPIVWQDTRTDKICNQLAKSGGQDRFSEKTG